MYYDSLIIDQGCTRVGRVVSNDGGKSLNDEVQDSFSSKGRVVSKGGGKYLPFNHTIYVCYSSKNAGGTCRSAILRDRLRFRREK